jgi:hypothetical protein
MLLKIPTILFCLVSAVIFAATMGCGGSEDPPPSENAADDVVVTDGVKGEIIETMDSGGYTYIVVQTNSGPAWVAGPVTNITVGETINLPRARAMTDFHSKSLDRTFDVIYFVASFGAQADDPADPHAALKRAHKGLDIDFGTGTTGGSKTAVEREVVGQFEPAPGGVTVAEIYENRMELKGRIVTVRGLVVKYSPAIMGTNWIHLQDGTGGNENFDLTVTTDSTANVGDLVTVEGVLAVDMNLGAGYTYEVLIQHAKLINE